jgi:hypothetical protein
MEHLKWQLVLDLEASVVIFYPIRKKTKRQLINNGTFKKIQIKYGALGKKEKMHI